VLRYVEVLGGGPVDECPTVSPTMGSKDPIGVKVVLGRKWVWIERGIVR